MDKEKRMLDTYVIEQSIFIGDKEVLFGVDKSKEYSYMVCYCSYDNPLAAPWPIKAVGTDDYLEAMEIFTDRVKNQIEQTKTELSKFSFSRTPLTAEHCIPDNKGKSIIGKVVVIDAEPKRYEYQHSAYQLVLVDGGNGASGRGIGQGVFGTVLSSGERSRWERFDVLGEIRPDCMPDWAKESLAKLQQEKAKKSRSKEER